MNKPVVIGSSTGGTQALELVLTSLPADAPGIAITQHMPERFTAMYAKRLDGICAMRVREASDGDRLERGVALIAPAGCTCNCVSLPVSISCTWLMARQSTAISLRWMCYFGLLRNVRAAMRWGSS